MDNKVAKIPLDDWLTRDQAAAALDVAGKTVDRLSASGGIQKKLRRRPKLPPMAVFHPGDIERLRVEREKPFVMPNGHPNGTTSTDVQTVQAAPLAQVLQAIAERLSALPAPAADPLKEPHFLTLKEARAASGLPLSYLREQFIAAGRALKTGGGWRIARADLEAFARLGGHVAQVSTRTDVEQVSDMSKAGTAGR